MSQEPLRERSALATSIQVPPTARWPGPVSTPVWTWATTPRFSTNWPRSSSERPLSPDVQHHVVDGVDITEAIRGSEVSAAVSAVASHPTVREALNTGFRTLAEESELPGIIIEGRDITTVVAPDAPVRILLTADEATRIARRQAEIEGIDAASVTARDRADSAVVNFMTAADGVTTIDTTDLNFDDTVQAVLSLIFEAQGGVTP